eukprot:6067963-Prymnesium_polylepis.2
MDRENSWDLELRAAERTAQLGFSMLMSKMSKMSQMRPMTRRRRLSPSLTTLRRNRAQGRIANTWRPASLPARTRHFRSTT